MTNALPYRLHDSLGYHLSLAARLQEKRLDDGLRALGLTRTTWCILLAVGNEGLTQPSDIADFVGIDRTATSRALRQMEADGLIDRCSGQDDGRTRAVRLTDPGRAKIPEGTKVARGNGAILAGRLSAEEVDTLKTLLRKLQAGEDQPLPKL